jgi:hypothetical protein
MLGKKFDKLPNKIYFINKMLGKFFKINYFYEIRL